MAVKIVHGNGSSEVDGIRTVEEAVRAVDVNPETVIVEKDGELVSLDEILKDGDKLELINVVSGG